MRVLLLGLLFGTAVFAAPTSLHYQLTELDLDEAATSGCDLLVTDYAGDGARWTTDEVDRLKAGGNRTVLAYLSVGEAEQYRWYWDRSWAKSPPDWLGPENPDWPGSHKVRYWHPDWRAILMGTEGDDGSYLDRILARGFDGVYLDLVDAYRFWGTDGRDMADFVLEIAAYARARRPGFLVYVQNAPELGEWYGDYLAAVDGIGAEDTWTVGNRRRSLAATRPWVAWLEMFRDAGKTVLAVDYPRSRRKIDVFYARAEALGFVPLAAPRLLHRFPRLPRHVPDAGPAVASVSPADGASAGEAPTFTWEGADGAVEYRVNVASEPSLRSVKSFPWRSEVAWTPSRRHWRKIERLAAKHGHGAIWWWVTARDAEGRQRSGRSRTLRLP